jgi:large subunit ribosomal protein L24
MQKIRKGDTVIVISGEERDFEGTVKEIIRKPIVNRDRLRVGYDENATRIVVEGVNMVKKHQRATGQTRQAGIIDMEAPIHISNVKLICPRCNQAVRVGIKTEDGKKQRVCKSCKANID